MAHRTSCEDCTQLFLPHQSIFILSSKHSKCQKRCQKIMIVQRTHHCWSFKNFPLFYIAITPPGEREKNLSFIAISVPLYQSSFCRHWMTTILTKLHCKKYATMTDDTVFDLKDTDIFCLHKQPYETEHFGI